MAAENIVASQLPNHQKIRYENLRKKFEDKYGSAPTFYARSSGRVNLIGEHIDYCGYAVLPMAIEQDIVIAGGTNELNTVRLANIDTQYEEFQCSTSVFEIDKSKPKWFHYFLCGYKGVLEQITSSVGMNILLDGTVLRSAGLSSSSALVCCAALATAYANKKNFSKLELAEICQKCERYIGTEGGGMDQAISYLAKMGTAKLIEFNPIRTTDVQLPDGAVFVISNCLLELNKASTSHYNTRVAECRLATQVMAKQKGLEWRNYKRLGDLHSALRVTLLDMIELVRETFHEEPYSKQEVCELLAVTEEELNSISLSERTYAVQSFKLHDRAEHVYSEAARVLDFKRICDERADGVLGKLGELMNASHDSCSRLYECSCEELDTLVQICIKSGAIGSRLTGAGWGGCAVSLVPADSVESFMSKVRDNYYAQSPAMMAKVGEALFSTSPGGGAAIYMQ